MDTVALIRVGDVMMPARSQDLEDIRTLPERTVVPTRFMRPRRSRNHRHFFAAIEAAYQNWPEQHDFQPEDAEHLRAWLLCETRYRDYVDFPLSAQHAVVLLIERIRRRDRFAFVREGIIDGEPALRVFFPRSIAWAQLSEPEFQQIKRCVVEVLESVIGIPVDDLVRGYERAAS